MAVPHQSGRVTTAIRHWSGREIGMALRHRSGRVTTALHNRSGRVMEMASRHRSGRVTTALRHRSGQVTGVAVRHWSGRVAVPPCLRALLLGKGGGGIASGKQDEEKEMTGQLTTSLAELRSRRNTADTAETRLTPPHWRSLDSG
eukprot:355571-Chlamydomonas_euryale.AAC.2